MSTRCSSWYAFAMEGPSPLDNTERMRPWRVAEWGSKPKPGREYSEDRHMALSECFAVLDGVSTAGSGERIEGVTLGQFAVQIGIEALRDAAKLERVEEVVPFVSTRLREALAPYRYTGSPSFVFVAYFPKWQTMVRVGDCSYLIHDPFDGTWKGHNPGLAVDADKEVVRQALFDRALRTSATETEALADPRIHHRMHRITSEWQPQHRNNPESPRGYGVITGESVHHIEYIRVPDGASKIILASDGYFPDALVGTLAETDALQERFERERARTWHPDDKTYLRIER